MYNQTVFEAGNSTVVTIPKEIVRKLNLKPGSRVTVKFSPEDNHFIVEKPTVTKPTKKSASDKAHQEWLKVFLEEDGEILDELAKH